MCAGQPFSVTSDYRTVHLPHVLRDAFGMSTSEARQGIKQGAVKINGEKFEHLTCSAGELNGGILSFGKRKFVRIRTENA